ncbi:PEX15 (YOL044W) [Zygosaccharomyces parabailii]|nr:PEX15 (YOL044W) [Zygosaccharomyces parabailii]
MTNKTDQISAMNTENGPSRLGDGPDKTTLNALLNDNNFGLDNEEVADDKSQEYQTCLAAFIRGDSKECLEKMHEFNFLKPEILIANEQIYALFQGACDTVKSFNTLGSSLQAIVKITFRGDITQLRSHISGKSRALQIAISNRYYRCCAKVLQMDSPENEVKTEYLESKIKSNISYHSSQSLTEDPDAILELQQLVETYIFYVKVALMHKEASKSLYEELIETIPNLSHNFSQITSNGKSVENCVLDHLEMKQRKSKQPTRKSNLVRGLSTGAQEKRAPSISPAEITNSTSAVTTIIEPASTEDQRGLYVSTGWLRICYRFIDKYKFSRQNIVIALVLLLLSARKIKGFSKLPDYITKTIKAAFPHIQNALKLLTSV